MYNPIATASLEGAVYNSPTTHFQGDACNPTTLLEGVAHNTFTTLF